MDRGRKAIGFVSTTGSLPFCQIGQRTEDTNSAKSFVLSTPQRSREVDTKEFRRCDYKFKIGALRILPNCQIVQPTDNINSLMSFVLLAP